MIVDCGQASSSCELSSVPQLTIAIAPQPTHVWLIVDYSPPVGFGLIFTVCLLLITYNSSYHASCL